VNQIADNNLSYITPLFRRFVGGDLLSLEYKGTVMKWLQDKRFALVYKASRYSSHPSTCNVAQE
jgi:hypothetical protein